MFRELRIINDQISHYGLDLRDLTVITECASGYYAYNTLVPVMAGAKKVIAVGRDSSYATFDQCRDRVMEIAGSVGIDISCLEIVNNLDTEHIIAADIVTNSGFVRPIGLGILRSMKRTAVIPLMWETWEFRESDLDLTEAVKNGILVLGTDESHTGIHMYPYAGMLPISLLFKLGLEVYKTRVVLLGGGIPGNEAVKAFDANGVNYRWFVEKPYRKGQLPYSAIRNNIEVFRDTDAVIFVEHEYDVEIIGSDNGVSFSDLFFLNPDLKIGIISGRIDQIGLRESRLSYFPLEIKPFGSMSYQPYHMGPRPVIELYSAGLKVGQVMARCRLGGMRLEETIEYTLGHAPAMDFNDGGYMGLYRFNGGLA